MIIVGGLRTIGGILFISLMLGYGDVWKKN
jgi:hypothetical protein